MERVLHKRVTDWFVTNLPDKSWVSDYQSLPKHVYSEVSLAILITGKRFLPISFSSLLPPPFTMQES